MQETSKSLVRVEAELSWPATSVSLALADNMDLDAGQASTPQRLEG